MAQEQALETDATAVDPDRARVRYRPEELHAFVERALRAAGVGEEDASHVATVLGASDLRGIESHGIARLETYYVDKVLEGSIDPLARETVLRETQTTLALDANNGLGHPASVRAMRRTIEKAKDAGCATTTLIHTNHYGIAGYYATLALEHDMIGVSSTNAARLAVPTYGSEPMLGTNPFAYAIPANDGDAFVLDMATTTVALGKLEIADRLEKPLKRGWAVDAAGYETLDPASGIAGSLLPLGGAGVAHGGHKGYGLGLLSDILCGVLGGGVFAADLPIYRNNKRVGITNAFFMAMRIDRFRDVAAFKNDLSRLLAEMRASTPAPGHDRVHVAGDPERRKEAEHRKAGIALDPKVVAGLARVAEKTNVAPPEPLST